MGDRSALPPCDLVMKGGITSGVIYPLAVDSLSRRYRLVNVGGASAGAIAAALAAAAEHGERNGGGGFAALASIPEELAVPGAQGAPTALLALFQAQGPVGPLFDLFRQILAAPKQRLPRVTVALCRGMVAALRSRGGWWKGCSVS